MIWQPKLHQVPFY